MKRIILVSIFFFSYNSFMPLNAQWAKTYRGSDHDWAKCIQQTNDGGYIVVGKTFDSSGDSDLFLLKLSSAGDIEWWRTYGGGDIDYAECIQQIGDGGYIVAGFSRSFGLDTLGFWLLKLSSNGDIEWQRIYRGEVGNRAKSIQQTNDGGYIIAGYTSHFDPYCTSFFLIIKFSSLGDIEWQRTYGTGNERAYSIQQTSDGGYIVEGTTNFFDKYMPDILILKLFSAGDIEWQRAYVEIGYEDDVCSIQQIGDGGYIVAGSTKIYGAGHDSDILILKLSSSGNIEWQSTYGGSDSDWFESIQKTSDGGFVVAGYTQSFYETILLLKFTSSGNIEWQSTYGGYSNLAKPSSIQETIDRGFVVAGYTTYYVGEEINLEPYDDILVLKLSSNGDINSICELIGSSNAVVSDSYLAPQDINITVQNTNIIPYDTNITPQDIEATEILLCLAGDYNLSISSTFGGMTDPAPGNYANVGSIEIIVEAIPDNHYRFSGWTGDVPSSHENDNPIIITMDSDKSVTANFVATNDDNDDGPKCFISTAFHSSALAHNVRILRDFRDKYLMPSRLGYKLGILYYKYSPFYADLIDKHKALKVAVRISLLPLIAFSYSMVHLGPILTTLILVFIFISPILLISFSRMKKSRPKAKDPKALAS